jgi:hypothetical protein
MSEVYFEVVGDDFMVIWVVDELLLVIIGLFCWLCGYCRVHFAQPPG